MSTIRSFVIAAALSVAVNLLAATPTLAAKKMQVPNIDFGTINCNDFLVNIANSSDEDSGVVLMWIDGYLSGVSGDKELNWKELEKFSTNLVTYCQKNPNTKVLDAAEAVGISK